MGDTPWTGQVAWGSRIRQREEPSINGGENYPREERSKKKVKKKGGHDGALSEEERANKGVAKRRKGQGGLRKSGVSLNEKDRPYQADETKP